jgi:hypothetical protein
LGRNLIGGHENSGIQLIDQLTLRRVSVRGYCP